MIVGNKRRWWRAAAVLTGCWAFVLIFTGLAYEHIFMGTAGGAVPPVTAPGSCAGAYLLMVL